MNKALPWILLALLAAVAGYLLIIRPRQLAAAGLVQDENGDWVDRHRLTGGTGDYLRRADDFATEVCPKVGELFGVKIGGTAKGICNFSRKLDPVHYVVGPVSDFIDSIF